MGIKQLKFHRSKLRSHSCRINSPISVPTIPRRNSCSTPLTRLSGIYDQKILQTWYRENINQSPPISPTYSYITKNKDSEIRVILKRYEINKKVLKEEFYSEKTKEKRKEFFKIYSKQQRDKIHEEYYEFLVKVNSIVL